MARSLILRSRPARVSVEMAQQQPEALDGQHRRRDLSAPVALPEFVVDGAVRRQDAGRVREALLAQGRRQGQALGPVEVEKRMVGVEEDGSRARQAATWRGK